MSKSNSPESPDSPESTLSILKMPDDVMRLVFSKLNFLEKLNAGLTCEQWEHLLSSGTAATRHWIVNYNVDSIVSCKAITARDQERSMEDPTMVIGRYVTLFTVLMPFSNMSS
jgi:hypothetical protein